jgi:hypothetical protein
MPEHRLKAFKEECKHGRRASVAFIREHTSGGATTWFVRVPYCGGSECEESQLSDVEPTQIHVWPKGTLPIRYE